MKNSVRIEIIELDDLALAFGQAGTNVGPRLGTNARTQEQKEWWCLRRYIFTLSAAGQIAFPISIVKDERPDFRCEFGPRSIGIEVTEATDPTDQRELTIIDEQDAVVLQGTFGGRFANGAGGDAPERAWQDDILKAVASKVTKVPTWPAPMPEYSLLLYTNSNAGRLIHDWPAVFIALEPMNERVWTELLVGSKIVEIAVICDQWLLMLKPGTMLTYRLEAGEI